MNEKQFTSYKKKLKIQWRIELAKLEKRQGWLAKQAGYPDSNFSARLKSMTFSVEKINKINKILSLPEIEIVYKVKG